MKVRLYEVCNIYKGKTTITKAIQGEYPLVVTAENRASHNEYQFDCRAVCVPLVSATGHGHALHYQEGKFALGTILSAVIPKDENILDTRYLYIYLSYFKDSVLVPLMRGSANVSLTIKSLGSAEIELPSIEKQKNIVKLVTKIERSKTEVDNKLEEQTKIISLLRNEILSLAVKGKLVPQDDSDEPASVLLERVREEKDRLIKEKKIKKEKPLLKISDDEIPYELPKGWEWIRLGSITDKLGAGSTPSGGSKVYTDEGIKFIRSQNVYNDGLRTTDIAYIPVEINEKMKGSIVVPGDILLNITGGSIGRSCLVDNKFDIGNVNQHVSIVRLVDKDMSEYIHSVIISPYIQQRIMDVQVGVSREGLSMTKLSQFLIPVPPLNEQKAIVEKVDRLMKVCDELELRIEQSKKYSEKMMESILKDSFKA